MMDHIRQRDWNSTKNLYDQFVEEQDIDNCVVERIIRNKFWDPMISSDEDEPPGPIDWDSIFMKKSFKKSQFRRVVPGYRKSPPHPKLSALTQTEHRQCIKVLSAQNDRILPHEFVGKPSKADLKVFEEKKLIYAREQEEYREWARHLWTTTYCIRALRPKPLVEAVYDAEYRLKTHMMQSFPASYALAAQIPLRADNHSCDMVLPKADLVKVDISKLPPVRFPDIYECKESILRKCPLPEPCAQHPCKFVLPSESEPSVLPLRALHQELAQWAAERGAHCVASEGALRCLLEPGRAWSLPLSVCEVLGPDGDKSNVVVLGSEYPEKKDPAPMRSYRAFRHLLLHAFTEQASKTSTYTEETDSSQRSLRSQQPTKPRPGARPLADCQRAAAGRNKNMTSTADCQDSDSDDETRLEIVMDDDNQNNSETDEDSDNNMVIDTNGHGADTQPRKILKASHRLPVDTSETENVDLNMDSEETSEIDEQASTNNNSNCLLTNEHVTSANDQMSKQTDSRESSEINLLDSNHTDAETNRIDDQPVNAKAQLNAQAEQFEISLHDCVCKDTEFESPPPRSYKNLLVKNNTTKDQLSLIVHCSHKLKNESCSEVVLEPVLEYQLELGGSQLDPQRLQALALALMLRRKAELAQVRVDGSCGEVVTIETMTLREMTARHGDMKPDIANTLYTTLSQLAGLLPAAYLLKHEASHGANALLYARAAGGPDTVPLLAADSALTPAQEARLVHAPPKLCPVLLPVHKYHRQLPLAFTYNMNQVAKENKATAKKKTPPAALQLEGDRECGGKRKWPKRRRKRGKK